MTEFIEILEEEIKPENKILYKYSGIFSQDIIKEYANKLSKLSACNKKTKRRLFYVFVELGQNIGFYSEQREYFDNKSIGIGNVIIYENNDEYGFLIGNFINKKALDVLEKKCKIINSLDRNSLREFKIYQRNLIPGTNGGAHIGLIMVALTTRKKIELKTYSLNDNEYYFSINVKVSKKDI